jgi:hypothetical protein
MLVKAIGLGLPVILPRSKAPARAVPGSQTQKIKTNMKITITHDQSTIDPSATYSEAEFAEVQKRLETEYKRAIKTEYPGAEIDFAGTDTTYSIHVTDTGLDDPREIEADIQGICERVFETGLFWL